MEFRIEKTLSNGLGRAGVIKTAHGEIKTPAFMAVGTTGFVRFLSSEDLRSTGAQAMLSNGYHLRRKAPEIARAKGLAEWRAGVKGGLISPKELSATNGERSKRGVPVTTGDAVAGSVEEEAHSVGSGVQFAEPWHGPTLTDSGGFQVMSLGSGLGKVVSMEKERHITNTAHKDRLAHVGEKGVSFIDPFDGTPDFIGPEESMQIQCQIGADIHMAFDELTSLADSYGYNIEAMERTERWAKRSLAEHIKYRDDLGYRQNLYAVLQGGRWEDLRRRTAQNLAKMSVDGVEFDGFGLGGAFLKEDLGEILRWCNEELPVGRPRHLLGLSHPDDIFVGAAMGADTFDCVAPTREARHGKIYTRHGSINLRKMRDVGEPLDHDCDCPTCQAGWTLGSLRAMWRSGDEEQKRKYYRLASMHNLRFIIRLTEQIRASIIGEYFDEFRREFLHDYYGQLIK